MNTTSRTDVGALNLKLANLRVGGKLALGADIDGRVVNLTQAGASAGLPPPQDLDDLLQNRRAADVQAIVERLRTSGNVPALQPSNFSFAPLLTRPQKIICVGFNYRAHAAETGTAVPKAPPLFSKYANALAAHNGVVKLPTHVDKEFDYETELVVVFGLKCSRVSEADALSVVAGYTIANDISARGLQNITSQFTAGKMSDGFAPLGPWMATRDRIPNPNALQLKTTFNREVRQDSSTSEMIFDCRYLISYVTNIMTVEPGDILLTGTPPGVIWGQKVPREERRWIQAGDEVVSSIEGIGDLAVKFS